MIALIEPRSPYRPQYATAQVILQDRTARRLRALVLILRWSAPIHTITVAGGQYPFDVARWTSDQAPAVTRVMEAEMDGAALRTVSIVPEDVLMREKTDQLRAEAGKYSKQLSGKIVASLGMTTLAGYAAFFVSTAVSPFGPAGVWLYRAVSKRPVGSQDTAPRHMRRAKAIKAGTLGQHSILWVTVPAVGLV